MWRGGGALIAPAVLLRVSINQQLLLVLRECAGACCGAGDGRGLVVCEVSVYVLLGVGGGPRGGGGGGGRAPTHPPPTPPPPTTKKKKKKK